MASRERPLLQGRGPAIYAGANDALSARLAERAGFAGIWVSSLGLSASIGVPDEGVLCLTEVLDRASVVRKSVSLPVLVDCEIGFGEGPAMRRLVREAAYLSIDGLCIEDMNVPKRNSFAEGEFSLVRADHFADRIYAMVAEREAFPAVVARTDALVAGMGVDEAVYRAALYAEAGADIIIVHTTSPTPIEVRRFLGDWFRGTPIGIIPTSFEQFPISDLCLDRLSLVIYANQALRASAAAMQRVLQAIAGGSWDNTGEMLSVQAMLDIVGSPSDAASS